MPTFKECLKGIVSDEKLENAITFFQGPLIDFVNKHKSHYFKLHVLEGKPREFYNFDPLYWIIPNWIKSNYSLSSPYLRMFVEVLSDFSMSKEKGYIRGLCEILCDWVIKNDYLRNSVAFSKVFVNQQKKLTNDEKKKLLDMISSDASFFRRERWYRERLFYERHGCYPNDYVSCEDHKCIMVQDRTTGKYKINSAILSKNLDKVKPGYYATLYFTRLNGSGHAMLVRRNSDIKESFSLFDPNCIALFDITKEEVSNSAAEILELLYFDVNFEDLGIIERRKGISESLATKNKSVAKFTEKEVRELLEDSNISMLTYRKLEG